MKLPEPTPAIPIDFGLIENLAFDHVSFKHQTAQYYALSNITFETETGKTIAFVGPSGSGKTTLVKLLVGLYQPLQGSVLYNKVAEKDINFEALRNQIGFKRKTPNFLQVPFAKTYYLSIHWQQTRRCILHIKGRPAIIF